MLGHRPSHFPVGDRCRMLTLGGHPNQNCRQRVNVTDMNLQAGFLLSQHQQSFPLVDMGVLMYHGFGSLDKHLQERIGKTSSWCPVVILSFHLPPSSTQCNCRLRFTRPAWLLYLQEWTTLFLGWATFVCAEERSLILQARKQLSALTVVWTNSGTHFLLQDSQDRG